MILKAIPSAASSPYALIAYAVAAIIAAYAGFRLRELQQVLRTLQTRPSTSDSHMVEVIKVVTQRPVPPKMTGADWIRYQRLQAGLLIAIALIIAFLTLAVVTLVKSPEKHSPAKISDISISYLQSGTYKVSTLITRLGKLNSEFTIFIDDSVPEKTKNRLIKFEADLHNVSLDTFLSMLCSRAGDLSYNVNQSTNIITLSKGRE